VELLSGSKPLKSEKNIIISINIIEERRGVSIGPGLFSLRDISLWLKAKLLQRTPKTRVSTFESLNS